MRHTEGPGCCILTSPLIHKENIKFNLKAVLAKTTKYLYRIRDIYHSKKNIEEKLLSMTLKVELILFQLDPQVHIVDSKGCIGHLGFLRKWQIKQFLIIGSNDADVVWTSFIKVKHV